MKPIFSRLLTLTLLAAGCTHLPEAAPAPLPLAPREWRQYATPEEAGFSAAGLEEAFRLAAEAGSAAVMAVYRGHVLAAWGDIARELELHSVRKSLYSAMYGIASEHRLVDLEATLADLEIDDLQGLTSSEKEARVADLLAARSGVYHPSAYSPADMDEGLPTRGSHAAGSFFYYNNWDFNVAAVILERSTGKDLFELFRLWIAEPLGMEDWRPEDGYRAFEPTVSSWPAHTFRMSTRDLARFGQLYLQAGRWNGRQVVPAEWTARSTSVASTLADGTGYGLLWWVYPEGTVSGERYPVTSGHRVVQARGTGGQALFLVPDAELVIVHRGDTDRGRGVRGPALWAIVEKILAARERPGDAHPRLAALTPRALPGTAAPPRPALATIGPDAAQSLLGTYEFAPGARGRAFLFQDRLYVQMPGEGEAELFALPDGTYTIRVEAGIVIRTERDDAGRVTALVVRLGEREIRARRVD